MKQSQTIQGFDLLRLICIIAVIGIHSLDSHYNWLKENLSFAVPCFVMLSVFLSVKHLNKNGFRKDFIQRRIQRLIPAFAAWTLIYAGVRWLDNSSNIHLFSTKEWIRLFFSGSAALHLYFVPLIFYYSMILIILPASTILRMGICLLGMIGAVWLKYSDLPDIQLGSPEADAFPFYFRTHLPFLFIGILIFDLTSNIRSFTLHASLICGICTLVLWINPYFFPKAIPFHAIWKNTLLFLTCYFLPIRIPDRIRPLITVSFGIYLSHHLFSQGLIKIESYIGADAASFCITPFRFILCLIISAIFCVWLEKKRKWRWLVT